MKRTELNASTLKLVLGIGLLMAVLLLGSSFYFAQSKLREYAEETNKLNTEAAAKQVTINQLQNLKKQLSLLSDERQMAKKVVAESQKYRYQDEIVNDITAIAKESNVTITSYTFDEAATAGTTSPSPAPQPQPQPQPAAQTQLPATGQAPLPAAAPTLNSKNVTIAFKSPLPYKNLLSFVRRIEQNQTRMQIANIALTKGESGDTVTTQSLKIEVYVK